MSLVLQCKQNYYVACTQEKSWLAADLSYRYPQIEMYSEITEYFSETIHDTTTLKITFSHGQSF